MAKLIALLVPVAFIAFAMAAPSSNDAAARGHSLFAADIYKKCASKNNNENVILSPYSIEAALSLASQGAEGESFNVLRRGLHLEGSHEQIANEYNRQLAGVKKSIGAATLKVANKVFVQQNYSIKKAFYDVAVNKYDSEVESVNFGNGPVAAKTINAWVEDKTNNKIKDLVNADSFSSDSRLVLVNAIYFKGPWEKKFDPELTADDDFWTSKTQSKKIPYMNKKDDFLYGVFPEYNISALALKYNNSDFSFLILLPNERDGLPQLEAQLDKINLSELSEKMYKQEVNVKIPKMKIESSFKLKEVLSELGMDNIFNDGANFSGLLDSDEKLKVSDVVHKAFIEVNEEGAEAAAATAVEVVNKMGVFRLNPNYFIADHPFVFVIQEQENTLFTGRHII